MSKETDNELLRDFMRVARPPAGGKARTWTAVQDRLDDPVPGFDEGQSTPVARLGPRRIAPWVAAVALAAAVLLVWWLGAALLARERTDDARHDQAVDQPAPASSARAVEVEASRAAPTARAPQHKSAPAAQPTTVPTPDAEVPSTAPVRTPEVATPRPPAPPKAEPGGLNAELALINSARASLKAGDAQQTLHLAGQHQQRFATGVLAQERRTLEIQALCALGKSDQAQQRADALLRRYPTSKRAVTLAANPCREEK